METLKIAEEIKLFDDLEDIFDEDYELEKKCESYFAIRSAEKRFEKLGHLKVPKYSIRKELAQKINQIQNTPLVRQHCSYLLRLARADANNGFRNLSTKEKIAIIENKINEVENLFGIEDLYHSKRNKCAYDRKSKKMKELKVKLPLRKDITQQIYRVYFRNLQSNIVLD